MKPFEEQKYKHSQKVRIILSSGEDFEDEIKGLNKGHALYLAKKNWEGSKVYAISYI
jgi:hypothetical protein